MNDQKGRNQGLQDAPVPWLSRQPSRCWRRRAAAAVPRLPPASSTAAPG